MIMHMNKSLSEQTARQLLDYAMKEGLKFGDKLPNEEQLAERFMVSRVSLREAVNGLKFLGLLDSAPRRGTTIAPMDFNRLAQYVGFHMTFSPMSEEELLEARLIIEEGQLQLVARNLTEEAYSELTILARQCQRDQDTAEEIQRTMKADLDFHRALLRVGGNHALIAFSKLLEAFFIRLEKHPGTVADSHRTAEEHLMLVNALRENNLEFARGIIKKHLSTHRQNH